MQAAKIDDAILTMRSMAEQLCAALDKSVEI
jgi:hypothetical protein